MDKQKYGIIGAVNEDIYDLADEVNKEIARGYKPLGGPFVSNGVMYQAMILAEPWQGDKEVKS